MSPVVSDPTALTFTDDSGPPRPSDVIELSLLMSVAQVAALEQVAHRKGLTAAQMVRRLLSDFITCNQHTPNAV